MKKETIEWDGVEHELSEALMCIAEAWRNNADDNPRGACGKIKLAIVTLACAYKLCRSKDAGIEPLKLTEFNEK